ncbi:serine hydrolase domain-containing protein [Streptomyces polyrhachis]|uniref:Serine hydrolase domain-containing protein n=1 Tax=Streptomyces polyrhachis TaxID=1282885 RepID=A0ABW2GP57_9ACTN
MPQHPSRRGVLRGAAVSALAVGAPALVHTPAHAAVPAGWQGSVVGRLAPGLEPFDTAMMELMLAHGIPGAQVAVAMHNKILAFRSYSLTQDPAEQVTDTSVFRIASLSKSVTAAAATRMLYSSALSRTETAIPWLGLSPVSTKLGEATVQRMLRHEGGLGAAEPPENGDLATYLYLRARGISASLPPTRADRLRALEPRTDAAYGAAGQYAYSNTGYHLLGHLIADAAGVPYETYVQNGILSPLGITRMRLGHTTVKAGGEVNYHVPSGTPPATTVMDGSGAKVPAPYGEYNLDGYLGSGSWLARAVDFLQFMKVMNGTKPTILSQAAVSEIRSRSEAYAPNAASWSGYGWRVTPFGSSGYISENTGRLNGLLSHAFQWSTGHSVVGIINKSHFTSVPDLAAALNKGRSSTDPYAFYQQTDYTPLYFPNAAV